MIERGVRIEENDATVKIRKHKGTNSLFIDCDGFQAYVSELEALALTGEGLTKAEIADRLGVEEGTIANRLWNLRTRNNGVKADDFHHQAVYDRARDLGLLHPIYIEGLKALRDQE